MGICTVMGLWASESAPELHLCLQDISKKAPQPLGLSGSTRGKEPACQCERCKRHGFGAWVGKIPGRRARQPSPVFLPGESHGQRSLATVHGAAKSQAQQHTPHTHTHTHTHWPVISESANGPSPLRVLLICHSLMYSSFSDD